MTKGREKSDGLVVPEVRRKADPTAASAARGGKETTASQPVAQLDLFRGTADSPQGASNEHATGLPVASRREVPKPRTKEGHDLPAMTMEEVADERNLRSAFNRVASNQGAPGVDGQSVTEVREHLGVVLPSLNAALLDGSYRPGMIRRVWIPKAGGGQRGLGIPNVIDRLVQQAVHQVLSPHFEPSFHEGSHGFRPGRSCHTAIAEAQRHMRDGHHWVVDIDLEKFFDRVHHQRLLARLATRITDPRLLRLIRQMLQAKVVMPDGVVVNNEEGTPQGGPLSPLLSNIVLDELDQELSRRGHRFVRYADDCNIYVRSERAGQRVMTSIRRFIEGRLRLKVNADKSAVARPEERHFVGFRLRWNPDDEDVEVLLSARSRERAAKKIKELTPRIWGNSLAQCIARVNGYLRGWIEFFRICTYAELRTLQGFDAHIRRRLRAILLKQWGSCSLRLIIRHLLRLGMRLATPAPRRGGRSARGTASRRRSRGPAGGRTRPSEARRRARRRCRP
jgi:RNA-directed DNA polymerase